MLVVVVDCTVKVPEAPVVAAQVTVQVAVAVMGQLHFPWVRLAVDIHW